MQRKNFCFLFAAAAFAMAFGVMAPESAGAAGNDAVYRTAQASQGKEVYASQCVSCHGANLEGNIGPALKGAQFQQMVAAQQLTGASLLAVIAASMPKSDPGGLTPAEYAELTAYILQQNGYPAGATPLSAKSPKLQALALSKPPPGH